MRRSATILAGSISLILGACAPEQEPSVTDSERRAAAEQHPQLLAEFGGAYDGRQAAYVARTGEKVAAAANLAGRCTFTLVNSDVVNAFAVPGCYIYITRGLLSIVNSEGELASVLAHELGHIAGRHSERQQRRLLLRRLSVLAVGALTESERLNRLAGAAAGFFTLRYSRKHEYEADDLGVGYLRAAGYDPYAAADMLGALSRQQQYLTRTRGRDEARSIPEWALTHPLTENRIARSRNNAIGSGIAPDALPEYEAAYLQEANGLLYGDDPAQGFVSGRRFAHPLIRIGFEAPPGFTLTNSPQAILIEGPDGSRGEFSGGSVPPEGLRAYAQALLANLLGDAPVTFGQTRRLEINGLPAIRVDAAVQTSSGLLDLFLAAYDAGGGKAYHFLIISEPSAAPRGSVGDLFNSFRLLSASEAASLKPRRIQVVTMRRSDTLQSLALRMASDDPVEHLLMLNGRSATDPPRAGEPVKLVVTAR